MFFSTDIIKFNVTLSTFLAFYTRICPTSNSLDCLLSLNIMNLCCPRSNPARLSTDFWSLWQMTRVPSPALSRMPRGHLSPQHILNMESLEKNNNWRLLHSPLFRVQTPGPQSSRWNELLFTYRWQGPPPVTSSHHRWLTNTEFWGP